VDVDHSREAELQDITELFHKTAKTRPDYENVTKFWPSKRSILHVWATCDVTQAKPDPGLGF